MNVFSDFALAQALLSVFLAGLAGFVVLRLMIRLSMSGPVDSISYFAFFALLFVAGVAAVITCAVLFSGFASIPALFCFALIGGVIACAREA